MSKLFERLLEARGLDSSFLKPKYEELTDPFVLPDMKKAVSRIEKAIENKEKVLIYGDYDVDGVTASTVMADTLSLAGLNSKNIDIMLPNRFTDGYGMSPKLIKRAEEQGNTLVITVDCGSRNNDIVDELNKLNIDSIITDHHEVPDTLPEAIAVINPKRKDFKSKNGLRDIAGVGVAFKLAEALTKTGLIRTGQEKWLLDLVILGTICDSMPLVGENRIFGVYGLKVLARTRRPGLKELMRRAGVKKLNSESIGFQIGPRLNAAGRLESAELSLDLLRADSPVEASPLAEKLEQLNKKRKTEQNFATKEITERGISRGPVIIETGKWHEGILGIIAGRLVEAYQKPAFVLSEVEKNIFKGSGRSFGDFNLAKALDEVKNSIISGGGHSGAAGVKVDKDHLNVFREKINGYYRSLNLANQEKYLKQSADLDIDDFSGFNLKFLDELKTLEPFGIGNEEPIFRLKNVDILKVNRMGSERNHLRLDLRDRNGKTLKLVSFFAPEEWLNLAPEDRIEPLIKIMENDYNGVKSVEARIVDIEIIR